MTTEHIGSASVVRLADYRPPSYLVDAVQLRFDLDARCSVVRSRLSLRANPERDGPRPLELNGRELKIVRLAVDGQLLDLERLVWDGELLSLDDVPERCVLECETQLRPQDNRALEGLYRSGGLFCTDCEPEGFRRITCFPDRPDVLAVYTVSVVAPADCPVVLSNGQLVSQWRDADGRYRVVWHDPHPKPCYLFALVAGQLDCIKASHRTRSGRELQLGIYVDRRYREQCDHAMRSLQAAMHWDEARYGLECDLDEFKLVAVEDFNSGAMENTGLNLFNTQCLLATPDIATDSDFRAVERVVAHEYFHHWSGNRVTLRDWFQLSLKEGLTVFRESCFAADMDPSGVCRLDEARFLREVQFAEDAGPLAHPVRPDHYVEISNFYTPTVYEKGAELMRMLRQLVGAPSWRRGAELYFQRHCGQAVRCEELMAAMAEASGRDLSQFMLWYTEHGTARLEVSGLWDAAAQCYRLTVRQLRGDGDGAVPLLMPLAVALVGAGGELPLRLAGSDAPAAYSVMLELCEREHQFVFEGVSEEPTPSLLRGFSAPVELNFDYSDAQLALLMRKDGDAFCRWDACQRLLRRAVHAQLRCESAIAAPALPPMLVQSYGALLVATDIPAALLARMLELPSETWLSSTGERIAPIALHRARLRVATLLAAELREPLWACWHRCRAALGRYRPTSEDMGLRALAAVALELLIDDGDGAQLVDCATQLYRGGDNLSDRLSALHSLINCSAPRAEAPRAELREDFRRRWGADALTLCHWLRLHATDRRPDALPRLQQLMCAPSFESRNPNFLRATVGAFSSGNPLHFHADDGLGYRFLGDHVLALAEHNAQLAARLLLPLCDWTRYHGETASSMRSALRRVADNCGDARELRDLIDRSMAASADSV